GFVGRRVVNATSVAAIPRRIRQGGEWITGNDVGREEDEEPARARSSRKPPKGATKAVEPGAFHGDEAFEQAHELAEASADEAPAAQEEHDGAASTGQGVAPAEGAGKDTEDLQAPPTQALPARAEQLVLDPGLTYTLPGDEALIEIGRAAC